MVWAFKTIPAGNFLSLVIQISVIVIVMRILIIADIHGKFGMLQKIIEDVNKEDFDFIISQGDFTDMFDGAQDFTQLEIADIVLQKLLILGKRLLCVPGNHDPYEIVDIFEEYGVNLHHKTTKIGDITFVGWGGADTPFNTHFEPSEEETEEALTGLLKGMKGKWALVTHAPPKDTKLDLVRKGMHVGSAALRKIITKSKPVFAVCAHIHENRGTERMGSTTVFYPGPAYEGYYGFVSVEKRKVKCEMRKAAH
jgi:Icc-related predicted phosphoesterase